MKQIHITKRTGFFTTKPQVTVYKKDRVFYRFDFKRNRVKKPWRFNLPPGTYSIPEHVHEMSFPLTPERLLPPPGKHVPKRDHYVKPLEQWQVVWDDVPGGAMVNLETGVITLDHAAAGNEILMQYLIGHEMAHAVYDGEESCDLEAVRRMLLLGYNPSQVHRVAASTKAPKYRKSNVRDYTTC